MMSQSCTREIRTKVVVNTINPDVKDSLASFMDVVAAGNLEVEGWRLETPLPDVTIRPSGRQRCKWNHLPRVAL